FFDTRTNLQNISDLENPQIDQQLSPTPLLPPAKKTKNHISPHNTRYNPYNCTKSGQIAIPLNPHQHNYP
ncbi:12630_t:CDS:2, partial [Dentiscutata heterogama]